MPTKKDLTLQLCSKSHASELLGTLLRECHDICLKDLLRDNELLCYEAGNTIDLYLAKKSIAEEVTNLTNITNKQDIELFTAGIHVARIRGGKITPFLGLLAAMRLIGKIPPPRGYVIVNDKAEKLFLYGRDVFQENILRINKPGCAKSYIVVLNKYNDALGWGRIRKRQDTIYIQNVIDAGWYLRSGV